MHDLHSNIVAKRCVVPQAVGTTGIAGGKLGKAIDRQGFDGVEFLISYGSLTATNATMNVVVYEGDVTGTMTSVADSDMVPQITPELSAGIPAAATRTSGVNKNLVGKVGYKGTRRYVNVRVYSTVTAAPVVDVIALLFNPEVMPTSVAQALAQ